jgi:hypothetical protein
MIRNLLYNCCPIKVAESVTRDNIAQLCKYGAIFNGQKIVNLKTGDYLESPESIKPLFASLGKVEFVEYANDPALGEYVGFIEGFKRLRSLLKTEITFYAHTKGVGAHNHQPGASASHEEFIRHWYRKMYRHCLGDIALVDNAMRERSAGGCYRMQRYEGDGRWIFAGAFYWINHYRLFTNQEWSDVPISRWTPEAYFLHHAFRWQDTFDFYTRMTVNCQHCGRFNIAPTGPIEPTFHLCPQCHEDSLVHPPIAPADMDDEPDESGPCCPTVTVSKRASKPYKRNLIYNCCALKGAESVTRDNVSRLLKYAKAFTGRKLINIKIGNGIEDSRDIIALFNGLQGAEITLYPNDPATGEYVGFLESWAKLKSTDSKEITFYAHTKGVAPYNLVPEHRLESIKQWYRRMYHECLRDPANIDRIMHDFATCGAFYRRRPISHFSGAFYWISHARLFSNPNWNKEPQPNTALDQFCAELSKADTTRKRFSVEMYPGVLFDVREFYDLYPISENYNLYVQPLRTYVCRRCGRFDAHYRGVAKCPKCGDTRMLSGGWPELGF